MPWIKNPAGELINLDGFAHIATVITKKSADKQYIVRVRGKYSDGTEATIAEIGSTDLIAGSDTLSPRQQSLQIAADIVMNDIGELLEAHELSVIVPAADSTEAADEPQDETPVLAGETDVERTRRSMQTLTSDKKLLPDLGRTSDTGIHIAAATDTDKPATSESTPRGRRSAS